MPSATPGSVESTWFPAFPTLSSGRNSAIYFPIARCEIDGENRLPTAISHEELTYPIPPTPGGRDSAQAGRADRAGRELLLGEALRLDGASPEGPLGARVGKGSDSESSTSGSI